MFVCMTKTWAHSFALKSIIAQHVLINAIHRLKRLDSNRSSWLTVENSQNALNIGTKKLNESQGIHIANRLIDKVEFYLQLSQCFEEFGKVNFSPEIELFAKSFLSDQHFYNSSLILSSNMFGKKYKFYLVYFNMNPKPTHVCDNLLLLLTLFVRNAAQIHVRPISII